MNKHNFLSPSKAIASIALIAAMVATTNNALAQNLASNSNAKTKTEKTSGGVTNNANVIANGDVLAYTLANVGKYFPDMKEHVSNMISKIPNSGFKSSINQYLQKNIINNIKDPKQQMGILIYAIENYLFPHDDQLFGNTHAEDMDVNLAGYADDFFKDYWKGLNNYITTMNQKIADGEKKITELDSEMENLVKQAEFFLKTIHPAEMKDNQSFQKLADLVKKYREQHPIDKNLVSNN